MRRPAAIVLLALVAGCRPADPAALTTPSLVSARVRDEALASARVWRRPSTPLARANFADNPAGPASFPADMEVACRFTTELPGGTTPKFYCALDSGEVVKVKYGRSNPELAAEVAATRLLDALGFAVDRMYMTASVRCRGCPPFPFVALRCLARTGMKAACLAGARPGREVIFPGAVIERRLPGRRIQARPDQGWTWFELDRIDPSRGGSSRTEVDALRLIAVLLAHWDNKGSNQRLLCPGEQDRPDGGCARPLLMVQDLGATFGPAKIDLHNWRNVAIWEDRAACRVSMKTLPFAGATFPPHRISEEGRQFALSLLRPLTWEQLRMLFDRSGVARFDHLVGDAHDADAWVAAFMAKVDVIAEGPACAAAADLMARGE